MTFSEFILACSCKYDWFADEKPIEQLFQFLDTDGSGLI
jgi:Ca2+-binding EF-hand superfamily protein